MKTITGRGWRWALAPGGKEGLKYEDILAPELEVLA
jgi:hypothetical protein